VPASKATQEIDMKARIIAWVVASALSATVAAQDSVIDSLSRETGLSTRDVKMVLGARTGHAEYLASYDQTQKRFVRALGKPRYLELMAGRRIDLLQADARVASVQVALPRR
jgi:hypothetical protein